MIQLSPSVLHVVSWFPSEKQPFLGNFIRDQIEILLGEEEGTVLTTHEKWQYANGKWHSGKKHNKWQFAWRVLRSQEEIIHFHVVQRTFWIILLASWLTRKKLILTEHSAFWLHNKKSGALLRALQWYALGKVDRIVVVSNSMKLELAKYLSQPVVVIANPLPKNWTQKGLAELPSAENPYRFIHISTLAPVKNVVGILKALEQLKVEKHNWTFTIVSDEDLSDVKGKVHEMGLTEKVQFAGPLQPDEIAATLQKHHALVTFSQRETFSIVNAEALFFGLHLISTPVGFLGESFQEVWQEVPQNDVIALFHAMKEAIEHGLYTGEKGRKAVADFNEANFRKEYQLSYHELRG